MVTEIIPDKIGLAILNTDRSDCLRRLLDSFTKQTDKDILDRSRVYVCDDSTNISQIQSLCQKYSFVELVHTGTRIGVAKNTNVALNKLQDKEYCFIFNNDCELLQSGWLNFYITAIQLTNIHHFCFQQEGLWGAGTNKRPETKVTINGIQIKTIETSPQGALLIYDRKAFEQVGYFDAKAFKGYGKSHWDWSLRISESGIQIKGFHDVVGSNKYIKVHDEKSITDPQTRIEDYKRNTEIYNHRLSLFRDGKLSLRVEM